MNIYIVAIFGKFVKLKMIHYYTVSKNEVQLP